MKPGGTVAAILLAAGSSSRMAGVDKQMFLLRGVPLFLHSLRVLDSSEAVDSVCVVFSESNFIQGKKVIAEENLRKVQAIATGGKRRQDSVRVGVEALLATGEKPEWLLIHDGARPFIDEGVILRGLEAACETGAAVAAVPVKDTIKQVAGHEVITTPDRAGLKIVQTPQVFRTSMLLDAHAAMTADVTDDASMVELNGGRVTVFEGDYDNIKVTTPGDLSLAEWIFDRRTGQPRDPAVRRWGVGFDGHALTAAGPLRLGGVDIPFDKGLQGHSDGDVLVHAITSALLGAAGLGDIGSNFPSSDASLAGIDSVELLSRALAKIHADGWEPEHLDATIIAQQPRLAGHVAAIKDRIAHATGLAAHAVNIKVTSTDHVGAIGEGRGIAAQAVATLVRRTGH